MRMVSVTARMLAFLKISMWPLISQAARTLLGGLMVGLGTALGNGCTSGHGICGNSRLSVRSVVYTLTFMAVGALQADGGCKVS
jgi:hypothetical protein